MSLVSILDTLVSKVLLAIYLRIKTKALIIATFTFAAISLFKRPLNIITPCSVKTYGKYLMLLPRLLPLLFKVTICDLEDTSWASSNVN